MPGRGGVDALSLSPKTVRNGHYLIHAKLGVRTDVELVRLAFRTGLAPKPASAS